MSDSAPAPGHRETDLVDKDRQLVHLLAFAGREFDRVRDLLITDDEPGPDAVAQATEKRTGEAPGGGDGDAAHTTDVGSGPKGGLTGRLGSVLGAVGSVAGGAARVITGSVHPRSDNWEELDLEKRVDWWVNRFGTAAAVVAAVPNLGGKLGTVVGVGGLVAVAAQVLVINAVAREMGVQDLDRRVQVAAELAFGRKLDLDLVRAAHDAPEAQAADAPPGAAPEEGRALPSLAGRTAALVWRVARRIWTFRFAIEKRQQGGFFSQAVSNLPLVGAVGGFVNERKGISVAAEKARRAFGS